MLSVYKKVLKMFGNQAINRYLMHVCACGLLVGIILLIACNANPQENIYFVSTSGKDTNPGTQARPWATFSYAVAQAMPGDTVFVRGGYYYERLVFTRSGEAGSPIVFIGCPGEDAIIDGKGLVVPDEWGGLIEIRELAYIRVANFHVRNSSACAIFANNSSSIVIEDNYTFNSIWPGIMAWGDKDLVIRGNEVVEACKGGQGYQECISVSHTDGFEISGNHVHHGDMEGIDVKVGCRHGSIHHNSVHDLPRLGIYIDAWNQHTYDIDVYGNTVYNNKEGINVNSENGGSIDDIRVFDNLVYENEKAGLWTAVNPGFNEAPHTITKIEFYKNISRNNGLDGIRISVPSNVTLDKITVVNNLIFGNGGAGVIVSDYSNATSTIGSVIIINNTIYDNGTMDVWGSGGVYVNCSIAKQVLIRNNVVSQNELFSIAYDAIVPTETLVIDHNLVDGYRSAVAYIETIGSNAVTGDPLFVDTSAGDFHLLPESPAIDSGSADDAPVDDIDGTLRPQGIAIDIGAYEYK